MSKLLEMNWEMEVFDNVLKEITNDLLSDNYKDTDYLLSLIDKMYEMELTNGDIKKCAKFRSYILIKVIVYMIIYADIQNIEQAFSLIDVNKIPLATSSLLFAIERETYQILHKKTDEEKCKFYNKLKKLLVFCKAKLKEYFINYPLNSNYFKIFKSDNSHDIIEDLRCEVISFRLNAMFMYKSIGNVESDYISFIATGMTWEEVHNFFNELNCI